MNGLNAVEQRFVDGAVEFRPALRVDAVDEQVGIEAGFADKGEYAAGGRVDGDQRAAALTEGVVGDFLKLGIEV
jgi:hypothetical protein